MQLKMIRKECTYKSYTFFFFTNRQSQNFRREVDENCTFLGYCAAKMGPMGCPATSVRNYHYLLH